MNTPPGAQPPSPAQGQYVTVRVPRTRPVVTYVLLGLTILVFLLQLASLYLLNVDLPAALGMKVNELILAGEVWRLFTPMLLHSTSSFLHIAFNMYALYVLGPSIESSYGHGRFLALYIISGFAGNVMSFLFSANPSLGSSTAIFGLIGAEGVFLYRNREILGPAARSALTNVVFIAVANLLFGFSTRTVDNWGHIGGLLGGTFFAWFAGPLYRVGIQQNQPVLIDAHANGRALGAGLVDMLVFTGLAAMKFFRGG